MTLGAIVSRLLDAAISRFGHAAQCRASRYSGQGNAWKNETARQFFDGPILFGAPVERLPV
jgi:hypothetical protein